MGRDQGRLAAGLATRILDGESASDISIVLKHPYHFIFDNNVLDLFGISKADLPEGSVIINLPTGFYHKYKRQVHVAAGIFLSLIALVIFQHWRLRREERKKAEFEAAARTDGLTGTIPRKYFVPEVQEQIAICRSAHKKLTLAFCDIDNLMYRKKTATESRQGP